MNSQPSLVSLRDRSRCTTSVGNWVCVCIFGITAASGHAQFLQSISPARTEGIIQYSRTGADPHREIKENDALQAAAIGTVDGLGRAQLTVSRAFMEFDVPTLPYRIKATLVLQKYFDHNHDGRGFDLSVYDPDTGIDLATFDKPVALLTHFSTDPADPEGTVALDVTEVVRAYIGRRVGLRINADEGTLGEAFVRGIGIDDGTIANSPPRIEVFYVRDDTILYVAEINEMMLDSGLAETTAATLQTAILTLSNEETADDIAAVNMTKAFISKIQAQRGKRIPEEVADALIYTARDLLALLAPGS